MEHNEKDRDLLCKVNVELGRQKAAGVSVTQPCFCEARRMVVAQVGLYLSSLIVEFSGCLRRGLFDLL